MAFAENLKLLRKHRGMTQKELADASGVSCSSIINYENERRLNPPLSVMRRLASALNVGVDELVAKRIIIDKAGGMTVYMPYDAEGIVEDMDDASNDDWDDFVLKRGEQDIIDQLTKYIQKLNREGAAEAVKRVSELTEIPKYMLKRG